uniref:AP180 N-terminal homology (ANTH) domain-containing protein n=1 Tax=Arundo donax TaxID=35708 RepID=A0A0A9HK35_ARUDO
MSRFGHRHRPRSRSWDFAAFLRAYAGYLDDRLKHRMQGRVGGGAGSPSIWYLDGRRESLHDDADEAWAVVPRDTPATETMTTEDLVAKAQQLRHLLDRFVACRPTGKARTNPVVCAALYVLVKESAVMYCDLTEVMAVLIDRFAELETPGCVRVHSIFTGLAKVVDELDDFYSWCKATDVCRPCDVPEVELVRQKKLDLMEEFIRDRQASASQRSSSPPAPFFSSQSPGVTKYDVKETKPIPAPKERQAAAQEENNAGKAAPAEPAAGSLVVVDDKMADFLNLNEDTSPPSGGKEHGRNLALALFDGNPAEAAAKWVAFEDPAAAWGTALVQSTSRLAPQRGEPGGGFDTTLLDGMYSHGATNATVVNARGFAGSASSVATRPPGATVLALPPPPGANAPAAAKADPFAPSLAVPPPTYIQMTDLQMRQRLLVEEQMAWQQYERQRATWSYNNLL